MSPFIFGLQSRQPYSAMTSTEELFEAVGHNTGNLVFHHAINQHFGGNLSSVGWWNTTENINAFHGTAVVPCANQLGSHIDYAVLAEKFESVNHRMVAVGLGAQSSLDGKIPSLSKGTLKWLEAIIARAPTDFPNISLRGSFSLEVMAHYGLDRHAVVTGCPSLFINPNPQLGATIAQRIRDPIRIAVAAGHHRWTHLARLEASLVALVKATSGSYIAQSPIEMVLIARGEPELLDKDQLDLCRDYCCPEMSVSEFSDWIKRYGSVFFEVTAWMEHYRKFDLVLGTRIHGVILALQAGVPGLCIVHDSRTLELCETMKVPYVHAKSINNGISRRELIGLMSFDYSEFDKNRSSLAKRYVEFLKSNGLTPESWLNSLASFSED